MISFQVECPYCKQVNQKDGEQDSIGEPRLTSCAFCQGLFVIFASLYVKATGKKVEGQDIGLKAFEVDCEKT